MVAQDVADVLAQEALDALAELAHAVDVLLADQPFRVRRRRERRDALVDLVVPAHVGDEVADDREGVQRLDRDRLVRGQMVEPRLAHQPRSPLTSALQEPHFAALQFQRTARSGAWRALDLEDGVEHDHARLGLDVIVGQFAAGGVPPPEPELRCGHVLSASLRASTSSASGSDLVTGSRLDDHALGRLADDVVVLAPVVVVGGEVEPAVCAAALAPGQRCARDRLRDDQHVAQVAAEVPARVVGRGTGTGARGRGARLQLLEPADGRAQPGLVAEDADVLLHRVLELVVQPVGVLVARAER